MEILGGHCAIEFMLGNQAVCDNSDWRSPMRNKDAYIDKVMKGAANAEKLRTAMIKYSLFCSEYMEP